MEAVSSLDEEKVLVFKSVSQEALCKHCIKNFDGLFELALIDTDRSYFCADCPLGRLVDLIAHTGNKGIIKL